MHYHIRRFHVKKIFNGTAFTCSWSAAWVETYTRLFVDTRQTSWVKRVGPLLGSEPTFKSVDSKPSVGVVCNKCSTRCCCAYIYATFSRRYYVTYTLIKLLAQRVCARVIGAKCFTLRTIVCATDSFWNGVEVVRKYTKARTTA